MAAPRKDGKHSRVMKTVLMRDACQGLLGDWQFCIRLVCRQGAVLHADISWEAVPGDQAGQLPPSRCPIPPIHWELSELRDTLSLATPPPFPQGRHCSLHGAAPLLHATVAGRSVTAGLPVVRMQGELWGGGQLTPF